MHTFCLLQRLVWLDIAYDAMGKWRPTPGKFYTDVVYDQVVCVCMCLHHEHRTYSIYDLIFMVRTHNKRCLNQVFVSKVYDKHSTCNCAHTLHIYENIFHFGYFTNKI